MPKKSEPKMPAFFFYTGDWKKDPQLSQCSLATRGAWIELLCAMHDNGRTGIITGTIKELAQICRCNATQMRAALHQLGTSKTAHVTLGHAGSNAKITVVNRRMQRELKAREQARLRQQRLRERKTSRSRTKNVQKSSSSSSSSYSKEEDVEAKCNGREREGFLDAEDALSLKFSEGFFDDLQDQKIYSHLDVRHVFKKYQVHCKAKGVEPEPEKFVGWLNREIPIRKDGDKNDDRGSSEQAARVAAHLGSDN